MGGIIMPIMGILAQMGGVIAPNQIPNLSLWYNPDVNTATKVTLNNSNEVTQIVDLSGAGHPANSFGSKYPDYVTNVQNGLAGVRYTVANSDNLDINPIAWAQSRPGFTIYTVARPTTFNTSAWPLTATDTNLGVKWNGTAWQVGGGGGLATVSLANDTTRPHIYGLVFDGTKTGNAERLRFRYDGIDQALNFGATTVGTVTSSAAKTFYFGGNNRDTPNQFMDGYLFEVMIWLRALNQQEILGTENYISAHWNI